MIHIFSFEEHSFFKDKLILIGLSFISLITDLTFSPLNIIFFMFSVRYEPFPLIIN